MIIERPRRPDSAIDALGVALRVLVRPAFLWAPIVAGFLLALPSVLAPTIASAPVTDAELEAYFQESLNALVVILPVSLVLTLVVSPVANAVTFRLAAQHLAGAPARPFGPGVADLSWRFFLQLLIIGGMWTAAIAVFVAIFAIGAMVGQELLVVIVELIVGSIVLIAVMARLLVATAVLFAGSGPWESIKRSWALTRGHVGLVIRWTLVPLLIFSAASFVLGTLVESIMGYQPSGLTSVLLATVVSPLSLVYVIVVLQLHRFLVERAATGRPAANPESAEPVAEPVAASPFGAPRSEVPG